MTRRCAGEFYAIHQCASIGCDGLVEVIDRRCSVLCVSGQKQPTDGGKHYFETSNEPTTEKMIASIDVISCLHSWPHAHFFFNILISIASILHTHFTCCLSAAPFLHILTLLAFLHGNVPPNNGQKTSSKGHPYDTYGRWDASDVISKMQFGE